MVLLMLWGLVIAVIVWLGLRRPKAGYIERWAGRYGVPSHGEHRSRIEGYLTRTRRMRFSFALVGFLVHPLVAGLVPMYANALVLTVVGYLVGVVLAEATLRGPEARSPSAVLSPRRLTSYVPRYGVAALAGLPVLTMTGAALFAAIYPGHRFHLPEPSVLVGAGGAAVLFAIAAGAVMQAIVRRPQPAASGELVQLDDAMRSSSLHALAGAAVSLELLLLAYVLAGLQGALAARELWPQDLLAMLALSALGLAVASWILLGHPRNWRTRRPVVEARSS